VLEEKFIDLFLVLKNGEMKKTFKISDNHANELFLGRSVTTRVWLHNFTNKRGHAKRDLFLKRKEADSPALRANQLLSVLYLIAPT
jgi:hypothetical protein